MSASAAKSFLEEIIERSIKENKLRFPANGNNKQQQAQGLTKKQQRIQQNQRRL
jgi:hypothetical protein